MPWRAPSLEDLIGIEHSKLGFFQELRQTIEALKDANTQSSQRRREIAAILDGITDIMMVLTPDLRILSVNHVFRQVFPDPAPEGKFCYEIFRGENHPCPNCPAQRSFATGDICRETAIFKINGKNIQFEMVASPIHHPDDPEQHILVFKRDVTREKEYQAKFYQAEKMATIGMLATGVAHEVNNPLTAIFGFAEGLRRRLPTLRETVDPAVMDDVEDYVTTILQECRRCQDIVTTLLTFSRHKTVSFSPVSLNAVVEDTLKLLRSHLRQRNQAKITVRTELCEDLPMVSGDEHQIKQVMLNLLVNAMDAIVGPGHIIITTFQEASGAVCLSVEDSGCGVPKENMDKLFEPFFTTKRAGKGIGIGLSTCMTIVNKHQGEITVKSKPGEGSVFIVKLPVNTDKTS
ncbi:PAS/PAC sensor signal transduction histidine kinase [Solidesulfovibrio fructosivorans JJ]]|uniref:histidine kinase n=1 Tax=Solidesulfovibrio fructosivorans JJ] TaxID=596151 RepID=E1JT28_SOLFR|nr:ATP-binding protein [Solidesulfovibrio fructosivorans]EFL52661.1 PAS/PAC sensor signal transduction histidine kinase [Solidesulfovibrio fructosivorans JJ]]